MDQSLYNSLVDISESDATRIGKADLILENARWATTAMEGYSREQTMTIVDAVGQTAHNLAGELAKKTVEESGFGVIKHKKLKNELTTLPLIEYYRKFDFVNPHIDKQKKIVEIPRPAGVVFALTPSTNPIATINFKTILALMTRNSIVISPHPAVKNTSIEAANALIEVAEEKGAPKGIIQIIEEPSIPFIEAFMSSEKTNVILATGGTPMVRSAYSSSNPAIGVGPGNAPVFVDTTADLNHVANCIIESKSFDNSVLCTNESVLIVLDEIEKQLGSKLKSAGAYICNEEECNQIRSYLFNQSGFNVEAIGRDATWIAQECGIRVPKSTKILVTPISKVGIEEDLSREKLCPVLALLSVKSIREALIQARSVLRFTGAGHSAAIHSNDEKTILDYSTSVEVYRVVVNAPCSQGAAGFGTGLSPSFTVGTGYFGRSSIGENIGPQHLIHWTKIAYNDSNDISFGNFTGLTCSFQGPMAKSPEDGIPQTESTEFSNKQINRPSANSQISGVTREELRRLIAEELKQFKGK